MKLWDELKERRITQVVIAYLAAGWLVLAVVDQLVDRQIFPELVYRLALVLYLGGIGAALVLGWYHGEKGRQKVTLLETTLLAGIALVTLSAAGLVTRTHLQPLEVELTAGPTGDLDLSRIAVLYFSDETPDGRLGHIADGLTESLIARLGETGSIDVISRNGALQVKGLELPRDSIASIFDAGTVVSGSVDAAGASVRVAFSIADGGSGAVFRRGALEFPEDELLELTDGVSEEVAYLLREWLGEEITLRRQVNETTDPQAWALLQRGERSRKDAEDRLAAHDATGFFAALEEADGRFAEAERRDLAWARPPTSRGQVALRIAQVSREDPLEASRSLDEGLEHVARALERDPRFAPALETRGLLRYLRWRYNLEPDPGAAARLVDEAEADLHAAVRIDPSMATAWNVLSIIYSEKSDPVNAKLTARRAYDEDAFARAADELLWRLYATSYDLEQFQDALHYCAEGARRFPTHYRFTECELWLLASRASTPDVDRAWELHERYVELTGDEYGGFSDRTARIIVGGVLARAGMPDSANVVFNQARSTPEIDPGRELLGLEAVFRLQMGETDEALELVKTYLTASPSHRGGWRWSSHWWWRGLQDHPEFRALVGDPSTATGN